MKDGKCFCVILGKFKFVVIFNLVDNDWIKIVIKLEINII